MKVGLHTVTLVLALSLAAYFSVEASAQTPPSESWRLAAPAAMGKAYRFDKIAEGVYYATANGTMATGGNNTVIVNDHDVVLVDAGTTPAAARALLEDIKVVTDEPVRWVVNTHFHYDHTAGNAVFGPDVEIVAQEYARHAIQDLDVLHREPFKTSSGNLPKQVDALNKQISAENDPEKRATLQKQLGVVQAEIEQFKEITPVPPTMTYATKMTLHRGQREIQFLFLGRGHTQGDTVVFLPKERIVCTGDLMESRLAYMGDGVFDEWITTLEALKKLDFDTVLPGHGVPFHNKALITAYQGYLKDLMAQVARLRQQGLTPEETAQKVDLTSHKADFPQIDGPGADLRGVRRMYQWMDERASK